MSTKTSFTELKEDMNAMILLINKRVKKWDKQIEECGKTLERIEYKIKHFGEAWPDNV